jgi:hypothetical protein
MARKKASCHIWPFTKTAWLLSSAFLAILTTSLNQGQGKVNLCPYYKTVCLVLPDYYFYYPLLQEMSPSKESGKSQQAVYDSK